MTAPFATVLQHLKHLEPQSGPGNASDSVLLERFILHKDESAFAAIVARHGSLVLRICRQVLGDTHAAEDAFQAAFLVLARRATKVRPDALAAWLYGVAQRVALKARSQDLRWRLLANSPLPETLSDSRPDSLAALTARELVTILYREVEGLPEVYRLPVILCCLEGRTQEEASRLLGWTPGAVKGRLERGRVQLHTRLARRGLTLSMALATLEVARGLASATPPLLVKSAARTALAFVTGRLINVPASTLAKAALKGMAIGKVSLAGALVLALAMVGMAGYRLAALDTDSHEQARSQPFQANARVPHLKSDLYGDPLPEGAVARMGSIQWRHPGLSSFVFLEGGKSVLTAGTDRTLRFWDVASARLVRTVQLIGNLEWPLALSPDGKTLARQAGEKVIFLATDTGKEIATLAIDKAGIHQMHFSPNSKLLALITGQGQVSLWDWRKGKKLELSKVSRDSLDSTCHAVFSWDSQLLAVGVWWMEPLRIYETATGREIHQFDCGAMQSTFSPDRKRLAVVSRGTIRLMDLATGKATAPISLRSDDLVQSVTFSPDGQMLGCAGYSQSFLLDCTKGEVLRRLPGLSQLAFAPNGKTIAGTSGPRLRFFDTGTGKELYDRLGSDELAQPAVSPDSRWLASVDYSQNAVLIWDMQSGRVVHRLSLISEERPIAEPGQKIIEGLAFMPDENTLLVCQPKNSVEFWDVVTGKKVRTLLLHDPTGLKQGCYYYLLHASADGKYLSTIERRFIGDVFHCERVALWESDTGKLVREYVAPLAGPNCSWSPDGSVLALAKNDGMELREGDNGRVCCRITGVSKGGIVAASTDQRLIAVLETKQPGRPTPGRMIKDEPVRIWEAASGKEVASIQVGPCAHVALANGGRFLVTTDEGFLRVWDLATGKERRRWSLPSGPIDPGGTTIVSQLLALPDGRRVITILYDGTALVWDLSSAVDSLEPLDRNSEEKILARWWTDLGGTDAHQAYAAVWRLAEGRRPTVHFLRERLQPVAKPDAKRIRQHLDDLDSDSFVVREKASKELESLGRLALPALREALKKNPPPEMRRRVEKLLSACFEEVLPVESVRSLRALHVLEQIGTSDARKLLEELANGAAEARLTREAKAALGRLTSVKRSGGGS
jgi:RNA polymerase sigma factor (sigma-70 family)